MEPYCLRCEMAFEGKEDLPLQSHSSVISCLKEEIPSQGEKEVHASGTWEVNAVVAELFWVTGMTEGGNGTVYFVTSQFGNLTARKPGSNN